MTSRPVPQVAVLPYVPGVTAARVARASLVATLVVVIAACGSAAVTGPTSSPFAASPSPLVPSSSAPIIGPSPPAAESAAPSADQLATIDDPDLTFELPTGWRVVPLPAFLKQEQQASALATGPIKQLSDQIVAEIQSNALRLVAMGPSGLPPWTGSILLEVTDAATVEDQVTRIQTRASIFGAPLTTERSEVATPLGQAVRLSILSPPLPPPAKSAAARSLNWVIRLEDGRVLWFNAAGPQASQTFEAMIEAAVATLRAS